jgi:hypothetical protein
MVCDPFPAELCIPVRVEHLYHIDADENGIDGRPRTRFVVQQAKFRRQMILILVNEEIDSSCVLLGTVTVSIWQAVINALGNVTELENPLSLVVRNEVAAEDLRKFSTCISPEHIHLPKAVLSRDVALRQEEIILARRLDVGNSVAIPTHCDWGGQAGNLEVSIDCREGGGHGVV